MDDKQGAAEALTEPSTSIKPTSLRSGEEKSDLHYQTRGRGWHRYGKIWQLLLSLRDTTKPHNPSSHQERGYSSSISSGQETGLIAKLKITESLSIHPSLDVGRLNKYGHTGLQVKWKDVKWPGLQVWGGFAPLKSVCLNFTSSLVSLIWDHHCSAIFSFGQMHIDHFQKWFLSLRTDTQHLFMVHAAHRDHTQLWKYLKPTS